MALVVQPESQLALATLAPGGSLTTLGYSAGRKATFDVTALIWKGASIKSFVLFAPPAAAWEEAWNTIVPQLQSGRIKPIVAKTFPLTEASDALRYLIEDCPFSRVVLNDLTALMYRGHGRSGQVADCPDSFSRHCLRMKSGIPMSSVDHNCCGRAACSSRTES